MSAAMCQVGMLLFSVTGFTLDHASCIGAKPKITTQTALPAPLLERLQKMRESNGEQQAALPTEVSVTPEPTGNDPATGPPHSSTTMESPRSAEWLDETLSVRVENRGTEWSDEGYYVSLPRPGGDA